MKTIDIRTERQEEAIDLTSQVQTIIASSQVKNGFCVVFVPHTTAGIMINENADPDVKNDIFTTLRRLVPEGLSYKHTEGNSPAHVKASLVGPSAIVIIEDGRLVLGSWQGIYFCEFDGPRARKIWVQTVADRQD